MRKKQTQTVGGLLMSLWWVTLIERNWKNNDLNKATNVTERTVGFMAQVTTRNCEMFLPKPFTTSDDLESCITHFKLLAKMQADTEQ